MAYKFHTCENCDTIFRVKRIKKPYIGMFKSRPVYHWYYDCSRCGHKHTVRFYNEYVNIYFDEVIRFEFSLFLNRNDEDRVQELKIELDEARRELARINDEVRNRLLIYE